MKLRFFLPIAVTIFVLTSSPAQNSRQDWTNYVRIGAYGLNHADAERIIRDAQQSDVLGIEVDNAIPTRFILFSCASTQREPQPRGKNSQGENSSS